MEDQKWRAHMVRFETHLRAEKGLAELTVRNYLTDLQPLFEYVQLKSIQSLKALDRVTLRGYLSWLVELGYVKASIVRKLSVLRSFLRWLLREKLIDEDPLPKRGVMKQDKRLPRFLSQEEAARLLAAGAGLRCRAAGERGKRTGYTGRKTRFKGGPCNGKGLKTARGALRRGG